MAAHREITQRDLRRRANEILNAVETGQSFTLVRDGRAVGQLIPLRRPRRFVTRLEFAAGSRRAAEAGSARSGPTRTHASTTRRTT
jgi:prevent-host-death family protein